MAFQGQEEHVQQPQAYGVPGGVANYEVIVIPGSFLSSRFDEQKIKEACAQMHARGLKLVGTSSLDMCGACFCMCKKPSLTLIFGPM